MKHFLNDEKSREINNINLKRSIKITRNHTLNTLRIRKNNFLLNKRTKNLAKDNRKQERIQLLRIL